MHFFHSPTLWSAFPALKAGAIHVSEVHGATGFDDLAIAHIEAAKSRLDGGNDAQAGAPLPEGQWPEIQAWRRVYSEMGLQPTQVRCAAEALLRRLRQDGQLPKVNPLVDLCNAISVHAAVPVAIFDCAQVAWPLCVARAQGDEEFLAFSGEIEHPAEAEVVFVDAVRRAHARKWAHRQSRFSAVSSSTESVLIVVEAFHDDASATVAAALQWLDEAFHRLPGCTTRSRMLSASNPDFLNP
jgi:DNA/RNA-binding domain of Phe-tRNA-synthetase-like protein